MSHNFICLFSAYFSDESGTVDKHYLNSNGKQLMKYSGIVYYIHHEEEIKYLLEENRNASMQMLIAWSKKKMMRDWGHSWRLNVCIACMKTGFNHRHKWSHGHYLDCWLSSTELTIIPKYHQMCHPLKKSHSSPRHSSLIEYIEIRSFVLCPYIFISPTLRLTPVWRV